jgi:hypothetical protein
VWRDHSEVESPAVGAESDGNEDEDRMDEIIIEIGRLSGGTTVGGAEFL